MLYLADTVAIIRHLRQVSSLGNEAASILKEADDGTHRIYLSAITLMEIMYLAEAKKSDVPLDELIEYVSDSNNYEIVPVDANVVLTAAQIQDVPELHDRIIVGTAKWLDVPILTSDPVIEQSQHVKVIW